jgi:UDP:flavonoid glycosyltransferase YjiC (YdhE family)
MSDGKTIAFFPEACYGPALNSVGIAQACEKLGHKAVFLTDPGLSGVYSGYGFEEHAVNMSEPMSAEEMAKYWTDFIDGHIPNFDKTPYEQIDNYVKECWANIVNTSVWAEKDLPAVLEKVKPDLGCGSFPAARMKLPIPIFRHTCRAAVKAITSATRLTWNVSTRLSSRFTMNSMNSWRNAVKSRIRWASFSKPRPS